MKHGFAFFLAEEFLVQASFFFCLFCYKPYPEGFCCIFGESSIRLFLPCFIFVPRARHDQGKFQGSANVKIYVDVDTSR